MTNLSIYRKTLRGFEPVNDDAQAFAAKTKLGAEVVLTGHRTRNLGHHKKFFKLLKLVFDNQDRYETQAHLLTAFKISIGHFDPIIMPDDRTELHVKSISFKAMDQTEFDIFWNNAVNAIIKHFGDYPLDVCRSGR